VSGFAWLFFLPQLVAGFPCPDAVERQLVAWRASSEVVTAPGGPSGGAVYRIATDEIGVWITLHRPRGLDTTSLFLTSARETRRVDVGPSCESAPVSTFSPPEAPADAFTDEALERRLTLDKRLVVYLWSPHLPLSVEGYPEIVAATAQLQVPLAVVVDGSAERGFVESVADANGIAADARRPMVSIELMFRDLPVHTPSILVFSNGLVSAPLPGYRNREAYLAHLSSIFGAVSNSDPVER
jgi:hypothetical protein